MKKVKIQFHTSGAGNTTGHMIVPKEFLTKLGITPEERLVNVSLQDNRIIIEKSEN